MKFLLVVVVLNCIMGLPLKANISPYDTLNKEFLLAYSENKIMEFAGTSEQEKNIFLQKHKYAIFLSFYGYYENIIRSVKYKKIDPSKNLTKTYRSLAHITEVITEHLGLGNVLLKNRNLTADFFSFEKTSTMSEIDIRNKYFASAISINKSILDKIYYNSLEKIKITIPHDGIFGSRKAWEKFKIKYFSDLLAQNFEEIFPWIILFDHLVDISEKHTVSERLPEVTNPKNDLVNKLVIAIVNELESFDRHPTSDELYLIVHESIKKINIQNLPNISGVGLLIPPPLELDHLANF